MSSSFKPLCFHVQKVSQINSLVGIQSQKLRYVSSMYIYIYTKDIRYFQLLVKKFRPLYKPLRKKQEAVSFLSKPPVFTSVLAGLGIARIGTLFGGEEHPIIGMLRVPRHGASQGPVIGCQPWMNKPRLRLFFIGKVPFNLSIR